MLTVLQACVVTGVDARHHGVTVVGEAKLANRFPGAVRRQSMRYRTICSACLGFTRSQGFPTRRAKSDAAAETD
jgi:hypothetical protein